VWLLISLVFIFVKSTKSLIITFSPHDTFFLLDGAWRIYKGDIPNIDFHDVIGPLTYAIVALGMKIHTPSSMAILYGSATFFAIFILMVWVVSISRLPPILALLFSVIAALGIIGNYAIGHPGISYVGIYNRYSYSLLSGIFIYSFLVAESNNRNSWRALNFTSNVIAGIFLMSILLTKLTFFPIALAALLVRSVFYKFSFKDLIEILLGVFLMLILCHYWFNFNSMGFLNDMNYLLLIGDHQRINLISEFIKTISANKYKLFIFSLLFITYIYIIFYQNFFKQKKNILWVVTIFMFMNIADIFIASTNTQNLTLWLMPLTVAIISIIFFKYPFQNSIDLPSSFKVSKFQSFLILISFLTIINRELPNLIISKKFNYNIPDNRAINSSYFSDLFLPQEMIRSIEINFVERLNDGFILLQSVKKLDQQRIVNLDFSNPFNFALGIRSPRGTLLYWHLGKSFDMVTHLQPVSQFKDVSIILIPNISVSGNEKELWQLYGRYISENYDFEGESEHWKIYVKK
jgi:hypothetical protein